MYFYQLKFEHEFNEDIDEYEYPYLTLIAPRMTDIKEKVGKITMYLISLFLNDLFNYVF
jgi:hypothetical protein